MTCQTPRGDRVLVGPEAAVFREALMIITDWVEGDLDQDEAFHEFGARCLIPSQRVANWLCMADVGHALLVETEACRKLTAVSEATVGAIFVALDESLEHEIDNEVDSSSAETAAFLMKSTCTSDSAWAWAQLCAPSAGVGIG